MKMFAIILLTLLAEGNEQTMAKKEKWLWKYIW